MSLDMNPHFERALALMEKSDRHLFITGKAGTGKSTLLDYFRNHTKKNVAVIAPTGVAAVNIHGQTIHSFFGFKPDITPDLIRRTSGRNAALMKKLDTIVIDEISMVRADLLDCIDTFLRLNGHDKYLPFGGVQMIFIGDMYQLPPVVTERDKHLIASRYASPYFFDANVFACLTLEIVELQTMYRQQDEQFIDVLNSIRTNSASQSHLETLNARFIPNADSERASVITLTTTNALAEQVNDFHLSNLKEKPVTYEGQVTGSFLERDAPAPTDLVLKVGAQVMLVNNDPGKRWVNGTIGRIKSIKASDDFEEPDVITVSLDDGRTVSVVPHTWEANEFVLDPNTQSVTTRATGAYTQYPLKLAWAVTIHKSQGKTFDQVVIDLGNGTFAHGQLYVALSRCRTLGGIRLKQAIERRHIKMDPRVNGFMQQFTSQNTFRGSDAFDMPQQLF